MADIAWLLNTPTYLYLLLVIPVELLLFFAVIPVLLFSHTHIKREMKSCVSVGE